MGFLRGLGGKALALLGAILALGGLVGVAWLKGRSSAKKEDAVDLQAKTDVANGALQAEKTQHEAAQALADTEHKQQAEEIANPPDPEKHDDFDTDH